MTSTRAAMAEFGRAQDLGLDPADLGDDVDQARRGRPVREMAARDPSGSDLVPGQAAGASPRTGHASRGAGRSQVLSMRTV